MGQLREFMVSTWLLQAFPCLTSLLVPHGFFFLNPVTFRTELCTVICDKCINYDERAKVILFKGSFIHLFTYSFQLPYYHGLLL